VTGPAIRRGEVWWTAFPSSTGGGIRKTRPAVVISSDEANAFLNRVQIVPVTSKVHRVYPSEAVITVEGKAGKAMTDQIATADKARLRQRIGRVSAAELKAIEAALRRQLAL
jgi:mRNA interferase MazF